MLVLLVGSEEGRVEGAQVSGICPCWIQDIQTLGSLFQDCSVFFA